MMEPMKPLIKRGKWSKKGSWLSKRNFTHQRLHTSWNQVKNQCDYHCGIKEPPQLRQSWCDIHILSGTPGGPNTLDSCFIEMLEIQSKCT